MRNIGLLAAVVAAMSTSSVTEPLAAAMADAPIMSTGGRRYREYVIRRSKYMPHQGKRERERARRNYERLSARTGRRDA